MPDNKQRCKNCKNRHAPPTGKKCKFVSEQNDVTQGLVRDAAVASESLATDHSQDLGGQRIQMEILEQLKRMSHRLDLVEDQVVATTQQTAQASTSGKLSTDTVLSSSSKKSSKSKKSRPTYVTSDSSSDESDTPSMKQLKSNAIQKKVDSRLRELNHSSHLPGSDSSVKLKSKRGGSVEVNVKNKVSWPHEAILGGVSRQRVTYDQLTLTQWVQGFCKNIMEESCNDRRYTMVSYLNDLMEDATDFSWQSAKAAHAVLLCEMERGSLQWEDMDRIDRIRRAHAQKHVAGRGGWAKPSDLSGRKPWFCKSFQTGVCSHTGDHENNGKLQRHICAHCLKGGRQLNHPEKDCNVKKQAKNDQAAAHH